MNTNFWTNPWLSMEPLIQQAIVPISAQEQAYSVNHYWIQGISWNYSVLRNLVSDFAIKDLNSAYLKLYWIEILRFGNLYQVKIIRLNLGMITCVMLLMGPTISRSSFGKFRYPNGYTCFFGKLVIGKSWVTLRGRRDS